MKSYFSFFFAVILQQSVQAGHVPINNQQNAPIPKEIEDPTCIGIHKEPAHATLMPYANLAEALGANRHASSLSQSLNGTWKFNWVNTPEKRPVDFYKPSFDVSHWDDIPVPSNWQVLGYGTPYYRNIGYTFQADFPYVMHEPPAEYTAFGERNPVGSYRRDFDVPNSWNGNQVWITFDGVDAGFFLWINGQKVGYSVNSRNAAEFDITPYIKPGKNTVAVEVYRYTTGSYLEDQDMWRLSGIFRNVTLWTSPKLHIRDYFVKTDLDQQYKDASLMVETKVKNYADKASAKQKINVTLYDGSKKIASKETILPAIPAGEEVTLATKLAVKNPRKWTAETPNLYTTVIKRVNVGKDEEILSARTGFREIEIKGRQFLVNGVPIKLKGVNRHEHWPEVGHAITEEQMIWDLEVIKQGNCNHIRTCHYSDDPRWYELCDEYGIYVLAEANVECHGLSNRFNEEPLMKDAIVDRNTANVQNFKNHPSVIIWSLGNECGSGGTNFRTALQAIRNIDSSRPTHYEGFGIGKDNPADLDSRMYTGPAEVESLATDTSFTKPFYLCEYAHAMFNSMGSIGDYNDLFDKYPNLLGGAVWEYQDQGLWNRRNPAHPILAFGGGFGEFPNDHYFIHKGVVASDRSPKPHYPELKHAYQWISVIPVDLATGKIRIRNRYQFHNLKDYKGYWMLSKDGAEISHGEIGQLNIPAGKEQEWTIPIDVAQLSAPGEYFVRIWFTLIHDELWAKQGYEIASQQLQLPLSKRADLIFPANGSSRLSVKDEDSLLSIKGSTFNMTFNKKLGNFTDITHQGVPLLAYQQGPVLHLWRAPHQKDDMWANEGWEKAGLKVLSWHVDDVEVQSVDTQEVKIAVSLTGYGRNNFTVTHRVQYTVYGDGTIQVDNEVTPSDPNLVLARMGVRLFLNKQMKQLTYFGRGPWENYSDRKRAAEVNLYHNDVRKELTPYEKPLEGGNHEDVRWLQLADSSGVGLKIVSYDDLLQFSAVPYSDEQMENTEYRIDLPKSNATVLCISHQTLGVGSNACGPRPLPPYIVKAEPAKFSYRIQPSK
ncbi:glycoside hydrolase family 2 TIM barrel-domain containing protein [Olivibacter ginsenosidimutans]|uniref:beta-galactosidase n=1 Tax=Olivibacter ginsenosidimutans TaxID=1176537 RepID=A0ABP9AUU3_9SPHI